MSVFRRESDKSRVTFHCLELSGTKLSGITKLVEENGGEIGVATEFSIKFIPRRKYSSDIHPSFRLYDIEFIRSCVKKSRIVNPKPIPLIVEQVNVEAAGSIDWQLTPNYSQESRTGKRKEAWRDTSSDLLPDMPRPPNSPGADTIDTSLGEDTKISIRQIYPRLRVIAKARECLSSGTLNATSRVHPIITKHMKCLYDKVTSLQTNATPVNDPKSPSLTQLRNSKYQSGARTLERTTHNALITESSNGEDNSTSARPKSSQNDNEWNKPRTSGLNVRKQSVHQNIIVLGSSSDDEDVTDPILARNSIRFGRRTEESTDFSASGNEANSKANHESNEIHKGRPDFNVYKVKKEPTPNFPEETDSSINTNSEEEAAKAPTKSIKHGDVKYRLGNVRESGMLSNSESEKEGSRFARKNGDN